MSTAVHQSTKAHGVAAKFFLGKKKQVHPCATGKRVSYASLTCVVGLICTYTDHAAEHLCSPLQAVWLFLDCLFVIFPQFVTNAGWQPPLYKYSSGGSEVSRQNN